MANTCDVFCGGFELTTAFFLHNSKLSCTITPTCRSTFIDQLLLCALWWDINRTFITLSPPSPSVNSQVMLIPPMCKWAGHLSYEQFGPPCSTSNLPTPGCDMLSKIKLTLQTNKNMVLKCRIVAAFPLFFCANT